MTSDNLIPLIPVVEHERQSRRLSSPVPELWSLLDQVTDPEIPVVSLWEMGVLQNVEQCDGRVRVTITPTYSGCPAMTTMAEDVEQVLSNAGYQCDVVTQLAPAWSSDWLSREARRKLHEWGVAPPTADLSDICCPKCGASEPKRISEFGSTACKALYQCRSCGEPFDYFKQI